MNARMPSLKSSKLVNRWRFATKPRLSKNTSTNAKHVLMISRKVPTRKTPRSISRRYGINSSVGAKSRPLHLPHRTLPHSRSSLPLPRSPQLRRRQLTQALRPYPSQPRLLSQLRSLPPRLPPSSLLHPRALLLNHPQVSQVRLLSRPCLLLCPQFLFPRQSR